MHDYLCALHSLALRGYSFMSEGALAVSRESLGVSPEEMRIQRALQRTYLERWSVHVCIQLCTRGYTIVYTRVYSPLLGSRYTMGMARPRAPMLLLRSMLLDYFALALG